MHWYMIPCPDCSTENWLEARHFLHLKTKTPSFVICRKCKLELNPPMGLVYSLEWHKTLSESTPAFVIAGDPWPGLSNLAPKFETWLMKLMRVRDKCPEVAEVVEEMKACMTTREIEPGEGEEDYALN